MAVPKKELMDQLFTKAESEISKWRDSFGNTFLMTMIMNDEDKITSVLIEMLIREEYFDDAFINHRADYDLAIEFQLQHYHGIHKKSKK